MSTRRTQPHHTDHHAPEETLVLDDLPVMETVEFKRFANRKANDSGGGDDRDSPGIGSVPAADVPELPDDDSPTDEMPVMSEDEV